MTTTYIINSIRFPSSVNSEKEPEETTFRRTSVQCKRKAHRLVAGFLPPLHNPIHNDSRGSVSEHHFHMQILGDVMLTWNNLFLVTLLFGQIETRQGRWLSAGIETLTPSLPTKIRTNRNQRLEIRLPSFCLRIFPCVFFSSATPVLSFLSVFSPIVTSFSLLIYFFTSFPLATLLFFHLIPHHQLAFLPRIHSDQHQLAPPHEQENAREIEPVNRTQESVWERNARGKETTDMAEEKKIKEKNKSVSTFGVCCK